MRERSLPPLSGRGNWLLQLFQRYRTYPGFREDCALGVSTTTSLLCGLSPALHIARRDLHTGLAGSAKGASEDLRHGRLRSSLVVAEVGLSVVLLIATGLMVRTLRALERVDIGFDPAKVFYAELSLREGRYDSADEKRAFFGKVLDRVLAIPGVIASTETTSLPPYSFGWTELVIPGKTHSEPWGTTFDMCSEGYFQTLARRLLRGRLLSRSDVELARHVTVINQTLARRYFANEDPVRQRIKFSTFEEWAADWPRDAYFEIIGVVADAKNTGLQDAPRPEVYFPHTVTGTGPRGIIVRTEGNANWISARLRQEIAAVDPDVAVSDTGPMENFLRRWYYAGPRFTLMILGTFGVTGLLLVLIGIFSVMAYMVSLRTHENGIRIALAAQPKDVLRMVLKKGLTLILVGTVFGVAASRAMTRLMATQIWGVSATDPWTFCAVAVVSRRWPHRMRVSSQKSHTSGPAALLALRVIGPALEQTVHSFLKHFRACAWRGDRLCKTCSWLVLDPDPDGSTMRNATRRPR